MRTPASCARGSIVRTCWYSSGETPNLLGVTDLEEAPEVDEARHPERAGLDHLLDDLVIDLVAVVDDVDAELDALEDHLPGRPHGPGPARPARARSSTIVAISARDMFRVVRLGAP